jgi:hypothetical protein
MVLNSIGDWVIFALGLVVIVRWIALGLPELLGELPVAAYDVYYKCGTRWMKLKRQYERMQGENARPKTHEEKNVAATRARGVSLRPVNKNSQS